MIVSCSVGIGYFPFFGLVEVFFAAVFLVAADFRAVVFFVAAFFVLLRAALFFAGAFLALERVEPALFLAVFFFAGAFASAFSAVFFLALGRGRGFDSGSLSAIGSSCCPIAPPSITTVSDQRM
jgi:hypothetical protein